MGDDGVGASAGVGTGAGVGVTVACAVVFIAPGPGDAGPAGVGAAAGATLVLLGGSGVIVPCGTATPAIAVRPAAIEGLAAVDAVGGAGGSGVTVRLEVVGVFATAGGAGVDTGG